MKNKWPITEIFSSSTEEKCLYVVKVASPCGQTEKTLLIYFFKSRNCLRHQPIHIVPHRKFDWIAGTSSPTFPNLKYVAPREICVERNCFDRPIAK